ncbi:protein unc-45 homolog B-like [Rhopilema esculentum]|uniref:protein unc-45 homolog B-like n=1 Tax=Rhopilema esculentum TaxID=499914 RepID=UPI0031D92D51|eukprot:gene14220-5237_t
MTIDNTTTTVLLKEQGNTHFKVGEYEKATEFYSKAIEACENSGVSQMKNDLAVLYKNRSACHLKREKFEDAVNDATKSLELVKNDPKALFRRAQGNEKLGNLEDALKDAKNAYQLEPKNSALQDLLRRITVTLQSKVGKTQSTEGMVQEMIQAILDSSTKEEKRQQALNNLTILAHQHAGSGVMYETKALQKLKPLIFGEIPNDVVSFLKMVHGLCKENFERSMAMMQLLPVEELRKSLGKFTGNIDVVSNLLSVVTEVIITMVDFAKKKHPISPEDWEKWVMKNENNEAVKVFLEGMTEYKDLMMSLTGNLTNPHLSADARDCTIDALVRLLPLHKAIADFVLENGGVTSLLQVAACSGTVRTKGTPTLAVSETTHTHVAVALSNIYTSMVVIQKQRENFNSQANTTISKYFDEFKVSQNVKGLAGLVTILEGSPETAEEIASKDSILQRVLKLAESDDIEVKILAGEVLAYAASVKKICVALRNDGMGILKSLFKSDVERLKARGLVCMSKVGMTGAGNINEQHLSEDGILQLYNASLKFLMDKTKDFQFKKLAVEALAFLTMDANIKEDMVTNTKALDALFELAKSGDSTTVYGVCNCLVNLTNSFDKPEKFEELEKIAEYAQHSVPKLDEKDGEEYVKKRISVLVKAGITTALVHLVGKIDSNASKESIARIFHGIVTEQENRGIVVQQGGGKALIPLALSGTDTGKDLAAQAIAKIGITTNPTLAFPGQRCLEVVRPLIRLLGPDKKGLQQFEALMALTNLAQVGDDIRRRIIKEKGIIGLEVFMFEEHEQLRLAATECMCNMAMCDDIVKLYLDETSTTERLKLLVLFSGELEEPKLVRAATGALAILSANEEICGKILTFKSSIDILKQILVFQDLEIQHRAVYIVANMLESSKDVAEKLIEGEVFEILLALMQVEGEGTKSVKEHAKRGLKAAQHWGLIKENK